MIYKVYDGSGNLRYENNNWPMARAALDFLISQSEDEACPRLLIFPDKKEKAAE